MKIKILRYKFSRKFFGLQLTYGKYVIQYAFHKFGVYDTKKMKWIY